MIVLECEPPNSEIGKMRIRFYNRHGFEKCDFEYMQPTYHKETEPIVLDFMAQRKLDKSEFEKYKNIIYNKVYNIK